MEKEQRVAALRGASGSPQPWALFLQRWSTTAGGTGRVRSD
jgi:hypothetical protein